MNEPNWTPIIDQHATWIAVNPVQGCPKACVYCFLHENHLTSAKPKVLASPEETLKQLFASPFYTEKQVLALYTWTDALATPENRTHLLALLKVMQQAGLPNAITLITKCFIPDDVLLAIADAREAGLRIIVYLSLSGLGQDYEPGIQHNRLRENFPRLKEAQIPIIHYWRPAFPANATVEVMDSIMEFVSRYASCSVVAGLKVDGRARERLERIWPALDHPKVPLAEGVFPQTFPEYVSRTVSNYPIYYTNACALAYVLKEADRFAIHGTEDCQRRNKCPQIQRSRCLLILQARQAVLQSDDVHQVLRRFGIQDVLFEIDKDARIIHFTTPLSTNVVSFLTQACGVQVHAPKDEKDRYWNSGTAGAGPLILP